MRSSIRGAEILYIFFSRLGSVLVRSFVEEFHEFICDSVDGDGKFRAKASVLAGVVVKQFAGVLLDEKDGTVCFLRFEASAGQKFEVRLVL